MTKEYLQETAKEYIKRYTERLNKFLNEHEAEETDYLQREIECFENTLFDLENSEASHDGFSNTGIANFRNANEVCEEIGWEKFKYCTESKIKFLKSKMPKASLTTSMYNFDSEVRMTILKSVQLVTGKITEEIKGKDKLSDKLLVCAFWIKIYEQQRAIPIYPKDDFSDLQHYLRPRQIPDASEQILNWLYAEQKFLKGMDESKNIVKINNPQTETKTDKHETKADKLKAVLGKYGFFELSKVKQLSEPSKQSLIELISKSPMPYGIAMFDYLGFCEYLDREQGTKYKADYILSKLYNEKAKDGTSAKHYRRSLVKTLTRYKAGEYKETVKTDYQKLK
jgi:hypothetical protein